MLSNIPTVSRDFAQRMLLMLCCAAQPLSTSQIIEALALEVGEDLETAFNSAQKLHDSSSLLEICPGLVELYAKNEYVDIVRIAHFSVEEYLRSARAAADSASSFFHINYSPAMGEMASLCIGMLLCDPETVSDCYNIYDCMGHFAHYAKDHWHYHYYHSSDSSALGAQVRQLLLSQEIPGQREIFRSSCHFAVKAEPAAIPIIRAVRTGLFGLAGCVLATEVRLDSPKTCADILRPLGTSIPRCGSPPYGSLESLCRLALQVISVLQDPDGLRHAMCLPRAIEWKCGALIPRLLDAHPFW